MIECQPTGMAAESESESDGRNRTIKPRDEYHDLTPKMQAVVDAVALHPEERHTDIAEMASERLPGDEGVSRSYIPEIIKKQGDIIEQRRETLENQRFEGEETTEGDPFEALDAALGDDTVGYQRIQDRPVKDGAASNGETDTASSDSGGATVQTLADAIGNGQDAQTPQESHPDPDPDPDPEAQGDAPADPEAEEEKSLTIELRCPDLSLFGGRFLIEKFHTAIRLSLG